MSPKKSNINPNDHIEESMSGMQNESEVFDLERGVVYDATITRMNAFERETLYGPKTSVAINFDDNTVYFTSGFETEDALRFMATHDLHLRFLPIDVRIQRVQKQSEKSEHMVNRLYITVVE